MRRFWTKTLPALGLSLALLVGLTPAAFAEETHHFASEWAKNENQHWHECSDSGCDAVSEQADHSFVVTSSTPANCYQSGTQVRQCSVCGYTVTQTFAATGQHEYESRWTYDNGSHWHKCTTNGCTAIEGKESHTPSDNGKVTQPTCTSAGYITYTCDVCGATYTQSTTSALGHSDANGDGKCDRCGAVVSSGKVTVTFRTGSGSSTQTVDKGGRPVNPGTPTFSASNRSYTFKGWTTSSTSNYVYTGQSLLSSGQVAGAAVTADTTYYAIYTVSATGQDVTVNLDNTTDGLTLNSSTNQSSSARSQMYSRMNGVSGAALTRVRFGSYSGSSYGKLYRDKNENTLTGTDYYYSSSSDGTYPLSSVYFQPSGTRGTYSIAYTGYDAYGNSATGMLNLVSGGSSSSADITYTVKAGKTVKLDTDDFRQLYREEYSGSPRWVEFSTSDNLSTSAGTLYYSYGDSDEKSFTRTTIDDYQFFYDNDRYGDYALGLMTFVAPSGCSSRTVEFDVTVHYSDSKYVSGTMTIEITGGSGSDSDANIVYGVNAGKSVSFSTSDFLKLYQTKYSGTPRWVEFETDDTLSASSSGLVYANYGGSREKSFTRNTIDDYKFYYSDSGYGDYALNSLSFVASSAFKGSVTLDVTVYYSTSKYVTGTVELTTDTSSTSGSTITYRVNAGKSVSFSTSDFLKLYQTEYSGTPRWVEFETSDTLSASSSGLIYSEYGKSREKSFTRTTIDDYKFYYSDSGYGDYALSNLSFVASSSFKGTITLDVTVYYTSSRYVQGKVKITTSSSSSSNADISYSVKPGGEVKLKTGDFEDQFSNEYSNSPRWVEFETSDTLSASSSGLVYSNYGKSREKSFTRTTIDDYKFYFDDDTYGDYSLDSLSFVASSSFKGSITLDATIYYSSSRYVTCTVEISSTTSSSTSGQTISWTVSGGRELTFARADFQKLYQTEYSGNPRWVELSTDSAITGGTLYINYGGSREIKLTRTTLDDYKFYYDDSGYGDYALTSLSFVANSGFSNTVTLDVTVYYSSSKYVTGTLKISPVSTVTTSTMSGDIRYSMSYNSKLQINANDFTRFLRRQYSSATLSYVKLSGVPSKGSLYYNYYGTGKYGASKLALTAANCSTNALYLSPSSAGQYSLSELTYIPSGMNYCVQIPFTAYGTAGQQASGSVLVSVNQTAVAEVYGVVPKNSSGLSLPASSLYSAVLSASGLKMEGLQLLALPAAKAGNIYVGSGTSTRADTTTVYSYSGSGTTISDLRFVPANGYTGSVEIPYVAYSSGNTPVAYGKLCLGIVSAVKKFSDVTTSTWCYKYVTELSDAGVIAGYTDGSFKPNSTVTYGAALKLIMLAAGYPEQQPTVKGSVFSGYLAKARSEGIITRSNVNLSGSITRQQVAQIAAGALKLNTSNLSTVQPFTDTTDKSVRALNAAGVVEGYFSNGTSTFKPNNTVTRGQISAIVWRMRNLDR